MIKPYINLLVMLFFSWAVYESCQEDTLLPMMAGGVVVLSLLARLRSADKQFVVFEKIPLSVVIIASFLAGLFWRGFVPIPDEAVSPFPEYTAALQSASIFAAVLFWLRPLSKKNMYRLVFCAWLTVGLSMNVPFTPDRLMRFSTFCLISLAIVIFNTMKKPADKKYRFVYIRDYIVYSTLLIMLTTALFLGISTTIVAVERAFMHTMGGMIMPRQYTNFLRISSKLNLITPGMSAFDRRAVMEITVPGNKGAYLKLQVFENYKNGTWLEPKDIPKEVLPMELPAGKPVGKMTMFVSFENIIPSLAGITAVKGKMPYQLSRDRILYTEDDQRTRMLEFSQNPEGVNPPVVLSNEDQQKYTALPPGIADKLKEISGSVTAGETDLKAKARKLLNFFHENFVYSLDTTFSADDAGLVRMLEQKLPAYCTYFASAMTLLLRAEGIPSRVGAGFLTTELVDRRNNSYLVRVQNAHAWTEVLVPETDPATGLTTTSWQVIDATPPTFSAELKKEGFNLERVFEKMWLNVLRMNAAIENLDKDKLKFYMILFLLGVMSYINRQKIVTGVREWLANNKSSKKPRYKTPDELRNLYSRYEHYLKEELGETRSPAETDGDVIVRLKEHKNFNRIEHFVKEYHGARFGGKSAEKLSKLVDQLQP